MMRVKVYRHFLRDCIKRPGNRAFKFKLRFERYLRCGDCAYSSENEFIKDFIASIL